MNDLTMVPTLDVMTRFIACTLQNLCARLNNAQLGGGHGAGDLEAWGFFGSDTSASPGSRASARLNGKQVGGGHDVAVLECARRLRAQLAHVARIPALRAPAE